MTSLIVDTNMSDIDIKSIDTVKGNCNDSESSILRRTTRKRKVTDIQNVKTFSDKPKRQQKERASGIIVPPSPEDIRTAHVETITNVFRKYISEILETVDLTPDREKTRVTGLIKNLENARSLKKKVYVNSNMEYLVSSSTGTETYTVKPKAFSDTFKNVCNCGKKYDDIDRDSCKHCGAILFYNLDNYFNEYLNKKTNPPVHLQVYRVEKMLNKFDFNKPNKKEDSVIDKHKKNESENPFNIIKNTSTLIDTPIVDFLELIMTD
jgi:hypothetical protein